MADQSRASPAPARALLVGRSESMGDVSWMELLVDLFFVFAFLQVTTLTAADLSPVGLVRKVMVIVLLWHSWTYCAWLGNALRLDRGAMPLLMFGIATVSALGDDNPTDGAHSTIAGRATEMMAAFYVFRDHPLLGVVPDGAGVHDENVRQLRVRHAHVALPLQHAAHQLAVGDVHLAAVGFDVVARAAHRAGQPSSARGSAPWCRRR